MSKVATSSHRRLMHCLASAGLLAAGLTVFLGSAKFKTPPAKAAPTIQQLPKITTVAIEPYTGTIDLQSNGSVVPLRQIQLSAQVSGQVAFVHDQFQSGQFVEAGTLLVQIDPTDYEMTVLRLEHEMQQANDKLAEIKILIENAKSMSRLADEDRQLKSQELQRLKTLRQQQAASASEQDRAAAALVVTRQAQQQLKNQMRSLAAQQATATTSIELARIALGQARTELSRTQIVAPLGGMIRATHVEAGSFLSRGQAIVELEDTSQVEIQAHLSRDQMHHVFNSRPDVSTIHVNNAIPKLPVTVISQIGGDRFAWQGILDRCEGTGIDAQTRTTPCRIRVSQPGASRRIDTHLPPSNQTTSNTTHSVQPLCSGMFVQVIVHSAPRLPMATVPLSAVRPDGSFFRVIDGSLRSVHIPIIGRTGAMAIVRMDTRDLGQTPRIVAAPPAGALEGMLVHDNATYNPSLASVASHTIIDPVDG